MMGRKNTNEQHDLLVPGINRFIREVPAEREVM
jgi:hypothetical protein